MYFAPATVLLAAVEDSDLATQIGWRTKDKLVNLTQNGAKYLIQWRSQPLKLLSSPRLVARCMCNRVTVEFGECDRDLELARYSGRGVGGGNELGNIHQYTLTDRENPLPSPFYYRWMAAFHQKVRY